MKPRTICETLDFLIDMMEFIIIMFPESEDAAEMAKIDKSNLEVLKKHLFRKENEE